MNKVININLAGRLIPIDELAYHQLEAYLNRLKTFFQKEEGGDEIVRDMEDRMGELFQDKLKRSSACILSDDVAEIISIMGSPEQIESETSEEHGGQTSSGANQTGNTTQMNRKHLHRSKKDKVIGGVCGGLAAYFRIDPIILRVAIVLITLAWGTGIIVYLLLWALLPASDEEHTSLRRRLYRNPKQKVIGGVCSGIAAYANIDPIIPRVIFVAPLLGVIFFSIIDNEIFFLPLSVGGLPTMVLLYIILWASLPEANTVAEKLEMRGEKVDVQSLSQAIKEPESGKQTISPQKSGLASFFIFLVKALVFFILGMILIIIAGVLIAVVAAILGFTLPSAFVFPYNRLLTESPTQTWVLWVCIVLVLLIPFITIIRLLVRVVSGRSRKSNKWVNIVQVMLFIAGIFGLFWGISSIASDFQSSYRKTYAVNLQQPLTDTLIIKKALINKNGMEDEDWDDHSISHYNGFRFRNDSTIALGNISLNLVCSPDSLFHMRLQKKARGRNSERAKMMAEAIPFRFYQNAKTLFLPIDFDLPYHLPFRGQKLNIELQIPEGKVFRIDQRFHYSDNDWVIGTRKVKINRQYYRPEREGSYYVMTREGVLEIETEKD